MPSPEIIYFTAVWSAPAQAFAPVFTEVLAELGLTGRIADVDLESELTDRCNIRHVPTVAMSTETGIELSEGMRPKAALKQWISDRLGEPPPPSAKH
ncbi:MAG: thioredoxin domain-containing protein [Flaviflexus sp.]|nr:thioredoxin domain-containing protein [Flaviflexus sp.]